MEFEKNKLSRFRQCLLFLVSVIEMTIFSSPLYGWSSLLFVLKGEGIYSNLCHTTGVVGNLTSSSPRPADSCVAQDERYNLGLNISGMFSAIYIFIAGWAIDRFGAKPVKIFSSIWFGISAGLMAITTAETPSPLIPSLVTLGIAYTGLFLVITRSTVVYGKWQAPANIVFACALSSSAVLFLIFKVLYDRGVSYRMLCYGFLCSSLVLLFSAIVVFPNIATEDQDDQETKKKMRNKSMKDSSSSATDTTTVRDLLKHMKSGVFIGTCLFIGLCRWRLWFFLSSFQQFMTALPNMDVQSVALYANFYGITQLCSVAIGPLVGLLIAAAVQRLKNYRGSRQEFTTALVHEQCHDCKHEAVGGNDLSAAERAGEVRGCVVYFGVGAVLFMMINALMVVPNAPTQIFSFLLVTLLRCFYTGGFANLYLVAFPVKYFGKLYGIGSFLGSIMQLLQFPTFVILENYFPGEIMKFNVAFLVLSVPLIVGFPCYLWHFGNHLEREARLPESATHTCETEVFVERVLYQRITVV